ncbi:hypothetical protein PtrM4_056770 [Pyrenophora tritici-repentis]|uniref:Uncharacterized protein n=1 Tax=Pyrenophora tritici-repentis TaxID=45151 RepID=A0A317AL05_9PLEO|nr:hypothetical protein PtrM4_056770 [Pyrenophora tritici-repentis]
MATIQTQRDATVILTDSSNWIPWYRQLKLKCQSQGIWPLLDPEGVRLQRIQPEAPLPQTFRSMNRQVAPQLPYRIPPETLEATREDQHKTLQKCRQQPHESPLYQRECQNS